MDFGFLSSDDVAQLGQEATNQLVYPDVSYGSPDEQSSTPAGNGLGQVFTGALSSLLNYSLQKDQISLNKDIVAKAPVPVQPKTPNTLPGSGTSTKTMVMIGGGLLLAVLLLARR